MDDILSTLALILSVISFSWTLCVHHKSQVRERRQATLDAFNVFQCQVLDELNQYRNREIAEIAEDPQSLDYKQLSTLLARCEHFSVGVNQKIYDIETVRRLAAEHIVVVYAKLLPLIEKKRSFMHNEKRYREFEQLAIALGYKKG